MNEITGITGFGLQDLRAFTGESGGTHGLDDVTKGIVTLAFYSRMLYPYCKYHGYMLKVSPEGIWRCSVTETFRKVAANPCEMVINHGCYFDNRY